MVITLGYGMILQHGRNVAFQFAEIQRGYPDFMAFVAFMVSQDNLAISNLPRLPMAKSRLVISLSQA